MCWFAGLAPPVQSLLARLVTMTVTAGGAALVVMGRLSRGLCSTGCSASPAESCWQPRSGPFSLDPAIAIAEARGKPPGFRPRQDF
jgi:hypothetical protein